MCYTVNIPDIPQQYITLQAAVYNFSCIMASHNIVLYEAGIQGLDF